MKRLFALPLGVLLLALTITACAPHNHPIKPDPKAPDAPLVKPDTPEEKDPAPRALKSETFAGALQKQLAAKKDLTRDEKRILRILNSPDSPRRDRQLARMEGHVRVELDLGTREVNWGEIDWGQVFILILELLIRLLPLLL